jgi:site-specific DNA recombinase
MNIIKKKNIRCATYARESDSDGMEHLITSVEAQVAACMNFIKSHTDVGWVLLPESYVDEGYSGATTNRPAFHQLKQDIIDKKIDMVVVYRFDRLARSVTDNIFFDEFLRLHGVEAISVTEGFDKSTALGTMSRYTAMVHAQYERDLISERTANKIAISKRAGLWMGGSIPLGYNAVCKQLVINSEEAKIVRFIFNCFIKTTSVTTVVKEAQSKGYRTKSRKTASGVKGGKTIDKGVVYHILHNKLYIGKIVHKDKVYDGKHEAIISYEQWKQVQDILKENCVNYPVHKKEWKTPAYLSGLMTCGECNSGMVLHSTTKKKTGKQYRYYTPNACEKKACDICPVKNILADKIEYLIVEHIGIALKTPDMTASVLEKLKNRSTQYNEKHVIAALSSFDELWKIMPDGDKYKTIRGIIEKVVLYNNYADITLKTTNMAAMFDRLSVYIDREIKDSDVVMNIVGIASAAITIRISTATVYERGNKLEVTIVLPDTAATNTAPVNNYNQILIKTIAQAFYWSQQIENAEVAGIEEIAKKENVDTAYVIRLLKLTRLAPDIIQKILEGHQPKKLRLRDMIKNMPDVWQEQREKLEF